MASAVSAGTQQRERDPDHQVMKVATIVAPGRVMLHEQPLPDPERGQVRVALHGCGVCASNLPVWQGRPWFEYPLPAGSPGHEGWGTIDAIGEGVDSLAVGDRVAMLSYHAFATHDLAPADAVIKLPPNLEGPFPGEPLGCAMNVFERADVSPGHSVCIVGVGFLGALLIQLARHRGAKVIAVARRSWACKLAENCGADQAVQMTSTGDTAQQIGSLTNGQGCDRVFEVTGHQEPLDLAGQLVRVRGKLIIAGYHQDGLRQVNLQQWNWNGIDVINAHERDPERYVHGIKQAAEAVSQGYLKPQALYTHRYPLDHLAEALDMACQRPDSFVKALILMPGHESC
mgnify:CR=1 FL=1